MKNERMVTGLVLLVCLLVGATMASYAVTPKLINYQGYLRQNGNPVTGNRYFEFQIYDAETGPNQKWTSNSTQCYVSNGLFRHVLGSTTGGITGIDWENDTNYLEIWVGESSPDTKLGPRERLIAVPYSLNADKLDGRDYDAFISTAGGTITGGLDIDEQDTTKLYSLRARTGSTYGLFVSTTGNVGIGITISSHTLHVAGDIYATGDICSEGGIDPPYVLYDNETRQSIIERVAKRIPRDKWDGAVLFWNGEDLRFEIYLPSRGEFRDIQGNFLAKEAGNRE